MLIGIVGKANVGKSTFFKALTLADILIANYPFATIKPNTGVGFIRIDCVDKELGVQCNPREGFCIEHNRFVSVDVIDVAGLVPGAHEGKGMGSQFLDDLNPADILIHVVDISGSTNDKGEPVPPGSHDPLKDIKFLEEELNYWFLRILKKGWEKLARTILQEHSDLNKVLAKQLSGLGVNEEMVKHNIKKLNLDPANPTTWTNDQLYDLSAALREESKPIIIAANKMDVSTGKENLEKAKITYPNYTIIGCSAESELALKEAAKKELIKYIPGDKTFNLSNNSLNDQQQKGLNFIQTNVLDQYGSTGVQAIMNSAVLDVLKYIAIFPGGVNNLTDQHGNVLPDCFLLKEGSTALDFAYKLHTDFGDNFIKAIDVRTKKAVGKDHILNHRDIVEIVTRK